MTFRVGFGFDVHALKDGIPCFLGGVEIPSPKGMVAHSDGDVLIHAICDAILGATNLRDIGYHFPDTQHKYNNIRSTELLKETFRLIKEKGYTVENIDTTVVAEVPKIAPYVDIMKQELAKILNISIDAISIKATTNEKMGFIGRQEGIVAYAVVLLKKC